MKISKRGEYALRCLLALTYNYGKGVLKLSEIANEHEIPYKFLEQIMILLKQAELVKSQKGKKGGYELARNPNEILLGEIVRLTDGPLAPIHDERSLKHLVDEGGPQAGLFDLFLEVRNSVSSILDHRTLQDLAQRNMELQQKEMYFI